MQFYSPLINTVNLPWEQLDGMLEDSDHDSGLSLMCEMFEALSKRIYDRYRLV